MHRQSNLLLPTERQAPADAEAISHKLMVRAGLIRQIGSGLWSWLPAGWRVHERIVQIIREELDAIGGQEMLMPVLVPAELWKRSGRYGIDELFKLRDRRDAELVLSMTHEEVVTTHVAQVVRSYRDLPLILYHFQTKERDEPRPRAGVLRTREFIMKDAYTFDRDAAGLEEGYQKHIVAYDRIFDRTGLEWYRVESDVGMMGGLGAHEYMAPAPAGENDVALAPGYAANVEVASADPQPVAELQLEGEFHTPGMTTIEAVATHLGVGTGNLLKAFPVITEARGLVTVFVRGDHRVNDIKLQNALGEAFRPAEAGELPGPGGFLGPTGQGVEVYDEAVTPGRYVAGANREDYHVVVEVPAGDRLDVRTVQEGDLVDGNPITVEPAIEVGNIFKLGTRYSEPLDATYLDVDGREQFVWMGSYGIGPARIAAAAVEQFADDNGISWPRALAPWDVHVVALGKEDELAAAEALAREIEAEGLSVLLDDRPLRPGEKFADAELLGCPLRLTVGKRALESGTAEVQVRRGREARGGVPLQGGAPAVAELWRNLP
ncbi:proline--tRNA ligase [Capillimicrobium parvum]|uniref:Proline--tRNA ligase n=1 Tax=Capillimicrobium parvum TaxID=2884022 RepID=A0A9E6XXG1_9ACTN|nr:proline--tRNA ligase [Capillimicrobium parvum]UGS36332.1 Proline--tRNA ligase [Capillimicrobium parvum]